LPVLVVFENKSAEDGFILIKEGAHLLIKDQVDQGTKDNPVGDIQTMDQIEDSQNVQSGLLYASVLLAPAGAILLFPVMVAVGAHQLNLSIIQKNITEKEIVDKTVYPGGSNSEFLYFQLVKTEDINHLKGVVINIKNIRSHEIQPIKVDMMNN